MNVQGGEISLSTEVTGKKPTISVVIPTFNRLSMLKAALSSIWRQRDRPLEIIVVNDGSTDDTSRYLASISDKIKFLDQPNRGPAAARNLGAARATGDYIAFLDSDDLWLPWTLNVYCGVAQAHNPSLILARAMHFSSSQPSIVQEELRCTNYQDYFKSAKNDIFVTGSAIIVAREAFKKVGGFDETMDAAEDHDFLYRTGVEANCVHIESPVTVAYRIHDQNLSAALSKLSKAGVRLIEKEKQGRYPGGRPDVRNRSSAITRVIRPVVLACFRSGDVKSGWNLYVKAFVFHVIAGRAKFLAGALVIGLISSLRKPIRRLVDCIQGALGSA